jgi:hypothetical protein
MNQRPVRFESTQEPLDAVERELMDPDTWDWENAEEGTPSPEPHLIYQVRLNGDDLKRIGPFADANHMHVGEFLRRAALAWIAQQRRPGPVPHDDLAITNR